MQTAHADYSVYREVVTQLMAGDERLPSLPIITHEVRATLEKPNASFVSLSKVIAKDPSLSALLLKYISSTALYQGAQPQNLLDVIRLLGFAQVQRITMVHTVKSLFAIHSPQHKRLFVDAWNRVAFKASVSTFVAKETRAVPADHALLGSLLSEIGTLAVLSAFKKGQLVPDKETFVSLCREYSKSLGVIMLKKWNVDEEYIKVIRGAGEWFVTDNKPFNLTDVINLGLYYSLKLRRAAKDLPPIITLSAYEKLAEPSNLLTPTGDLEMIVNHTAEIRSLALTMFKVTGN